MAYFNYCQGLTMTSDKFHQLFGGPPRQPESRIEQKDMDLAASIQAVCEEVVLKAGRYAHKLTGSKNLVMAGGVALNCVANGRLLREGPFENVWIQPAAGDAGGAWSPPCSFGITSLGKPGVPSRPMPRRARCSGPLSAMKRLAFFSIRLGAVYAVRLPNEAEFVESGSSSRSTRRLIGWFQGRMEFGPRAGQPKHYRRRPLAANAGQDELENQVSRVLPSFAPCVLREHVHEVFEMRPNEDSPYMLLVAPVRQEWPPAFEHRGPSAHELS